MDKSILFFSQSSPADMPSGHLSSVALYRLASEAVEKLGHAVFPSDWQNKVLFLTDISLRFVRAVEHVEERLTVSAHCTQDNTYEHGIAEFAGEIRFREQLLAVRFQGRFALR